MILRRRAALNGIWLDQVDNRILIQGIEPAAGKDALSSVAIYGGTGSRVTQEHRESLDITVKFSINEKSYRPEERAAVLEAVNQWAWRGGWLTVNYKPGRRIRVIAAQLPGEGDAASRSIYSIVFRAFGCPYWQEDPPAIVRANGSSARSVIGVVGSARSVLDVAFTNTSGGTINDFEISAGGSWIGLTGLGLGSGETLTIDHDDDGRICLLRIRIGGRSRLECRTGDSSNDLFVDPGNVVCSMSAGGSGRLTISCAGRFA